MADAASPDYFSCEENSDDLKDLFVAKYNYLPEIEATIHYYFKNSIDYVNFDSDLSIAAFHGCLRIGKVISNNNLQEKDFGFNKNSIIEIPIYFIPKFIKEVKNCLIYLLNEKNQVTEEKLIGEMTHKRDLYSRKAKNNNQKTITLFVKENEKILYELHFTTSKLLNHFINLLFNLILETTSPSPLHQNLVISFLKKLDSKNEKIVENLFDYWQKNQKLEILWNAVSEVVYEIEKKECKKETISLFNFIKKNIRIIFAQKQIFKIVTFIEKK